ncbi:MAG: phenylacetate--CoA ligase [Actinomycetota bacterium]|nr:phenylacetate--CoA ligase [Actinomycetota bacterium]
MHAPTVETLPAANLRQLQEEQLGSLLTRLGESESQWWAAKLAGVDVTRSSLEDIPSLPFTVKSEFRDAYPFGMLARPQTEVVRVHASSGTSGKPTIVAYTRSDIEVFSEVNARALGCAGGSPDDVIHVAYGYGLFTGGLGVHYGAEKLGAVTVPASGGNASFQVGLLADLGATGLACTPSFAMLLSERAAEMGVLDRINLRWGIHGAEPWSEGFRSKLEQAWGGSYEACDIYGLAEVIGPGVAAECREAKGGMHVFEDHFFPEIVDPETGEPVDEGETGELVITTLTKEAQPVIRYRTGDITRLLPGGCACGRTSRRISRIQGRVDDMLIIRGINVYPREIESILLSDEAVGGTYAIVVDRRGTLTELTARVEVAHPSLQDRKDEIRRRLETRLAETVRLRVGVEVGDAGTIPRPDMGKAKRVFFRDSDLDPVV